MTRPKERERCKLELLGDFQDEEYRHAYAEDFLNTSIATQIRVLREQRGLKQSELAALIGTQQAGVSRLENVNHSGWNIPTLLKIAKAFDVRLKVSFETFSELKRSGWNVIGPDVHVCESCCEDDAVARGER